MKKFAVIIMAVVITCLALVGCGNGGYVGKWELEEMSSGGMTLKDNFMGIPVAIMFQFEFKSDGTGELKQNDSGSDEEKSTFKWEEKDGGIVLTPNDGSNEEMKFTMEGDLLVASMKEGDKDATIKLKKVDEFTTFDTSSFSLGS
ncbi:MAG: hypothetical protein IJR91_07105 [Ruminococcus sp.]|nr:hypothetical protein [Ruminococcus sp.]